MMLLIWYYKVGIQRSTWRENDRKSMSGNRKESKGVTLFLLLYSCRLLTCLSILNYSVCSSS